MDLFKLYDNNVKFNVRLINSDPTFKRNMSINEVREIIPNEYKTNNIKSDIFFRPESKNFIMVDLDSNPSQAVLKVIKDKGAFLIIQTSRYHYQAWFYNKRVPSWEDYTKKAKYSAHLFKGDMASTKSKQVGRIPGYNNLKQGRNNFKVKIVFQPNTKTYARSKQKYLPELVFNPLDKRRMNEMSSSSSSSNSERYV